MSDYFKEKVKKLDGRVEKLQKQLNVFSLYVIYNVLESNHSEGMKLFKTYIETLEREVESEQGTKEMLEE